MWIGWLLALHESEQRKSHSHWLPASGAPSLLSAQDVEAQFEDSDVLFQYEKDKSLGFFAFINGFNGAFLYLNPLSHYFVFYHGPVKERDSRKPAME